jgi:hypothetical protein
MVRTVAYETLSRRDRKARHLLAAEHLSGEADADTYAAVIASHYLDANAAEPDADDAGELAARGIAMLETAAARATSLGTPAQARRHFERALEFASDDVTRARLGVGAASSAITAGDARDAEVLATAALAAAESTELPLLVAQALICLATAQNNLAAGHDLPDRLIPVFEALPDTPETMEARAGLARQIARAYRNSTTDDADATRWFEICIGLAEAAEDWQLLSEVLAGYGSLLVSTGRPTLALGVIRVALDIARDHDLLQAQLIPLNNLASFLASRDLPVARRYADEGLALARRLGDVDNGVYLVGTAAGVYCLSGAWDELLELAADPDFDKATSVASVLQVYESLVCLARGESAEEPPQRDDGPESTAQFKAIEYAQRALWAWSAGDTARAVDVMTRALEVYYSYFELDDDMPMIWSTLLDFATTTGDRELAGRWLQVVGDAPRGRQPYLIRALVPYFRARLNRDGDVHLVDSDFTEAALALRTYGAPYWLARCMLEHAEFLIAANDVDGTTELLDEAEQIFTTLKAAPWIERARRARALAVR